MLAGSAMTFRTSLSVAALASTILLWPQPASPSCGITQEVLHLSLTSVVVDGVPASTTEYDGLFFAVRATTTCFDRRNEDGSCPIEARTPGVAFLASRVREDLEMLLSPPSRHAADYEEAYGAL